MIEKRTTLNRIEIEPGSGTIFVRFAKEIVEDGVVISSEWHRAGFPAFLRNDYVMAEVDKSLALMGFPATKAADFTLMERGADLIKDERAAKKAEWETKQRALSEGRLDLESGEIIKPPPPPSLFARATTWAAGFFAPKENGAEGLEEPAAPQGDQTTPNP